MGIPAFRPYPVALRLLFAIVALAGIDAAQAQKINVVSANSSNGAVLALPFSGNKTTILNTDMLSYQSIQSVAFIVNPATFTLDVLVADPLMGKIAVYTGDFTTAIPPALKAPTTGTVIWSSAQGGPSAPTGLAVDGNGNLFVLNSGSGKSAPAQVWVFPAAGTTVGGAPCVTLSYAALCRPIRLDAAGLFKSGEHLADSAIVPVVSGGSAATGDLLVATNMPSSILDFPAAAIAAVIATGSGSVPATPLIATNALPRNAALGGLTFWPADDSLLVTNSTSGAILQYPCCNFSGPVNFAMNLGGPLSQIKAALQSGAPYAYVAFDGAPGKIVEFAGPNLPTDTITMNVNHPQGIAISNAFTANASTCQQGNNNAGCSPTGIILHTVPANAPAPTGGVVESVCVVPQDPRVTVSPIPYACNGNTLAVNAVCPGFDNTGHNLVLPGYLCGGSGALRRGFTLVKTLTSAGQYEQTLIDNESESVQNDPTCKPSLGGGLSTLTWSTLLNEGTITVDGVSNRVLELTDGCGSSTSHSSGMSLWGVGMLLNLSSLALTSPNPPLQPIPPASPTPSLADNKYGDLEATIQTNLAAVITPGVAAQLVSSSGPLGCVQVSQTFFDYGELEGAGTQQTQDYTIAANLLADASATNSCDSIVTSNASAFGPPPNPPPASPPYNSYGQVRSRLANLYFLINSRILGFDPQSPSWPVTGLAAPPAPYAAAAAACETVGNGLYPPPGGCPTLTLPAAVVAGTSMKVSWTLNGSTGCTVSSTDGIFTNQAVSGGPGVPFSGSQTVTAVNNTGTPQTYTYTLACTTPESSQVQAMVKVLPPPTVAASPATVIAGGTVTVSWNLNESTGCTLSSTDGVYNNSAVAGTPDPADPGSLNYAPTPPASSSTPITYSLGCTTPDPSTANPSATVTVLPPPALTLNPTMVVAGGSTTVMWTLNGATGCMITEDGQGTSTIPAGTLSGDGSAMYTSSASDNSTVNFTMTCASPSPMASAMLMVSPHP